MNFGTDTRETVFVMGTPAFMEFVESIQSEGVQLEYKPMGGGVGPSESLIIEVDKENPAKNIDQLDIQLPKLTRRYEREFKNLDALDPATCERPTANSGSSKPRGAKYSTCRRR